MSTDKDNPTPATPSEEATELLPESGNSDEATEIMPEPNAAAVAAASPLARMNSGYVLKDRFTLEDKLGEGGMGAVFRAIDQRKVETRHPNPTVAIKLLTGNFAQDSRAFIALQRETDKSQTLAHPNIITVYDFDRDGDVFFMTMESLVGDTLDDYIKKPDRERSDAIRYITDLANGIAYAHKRNIVHSDLKPPNVFVTSEKTLKILDFGIARAVADAGSPSADPDEVVGLTPGYASCEQFERKDPHPADDVYAVGLIAYELLTGKHPFRGKKAIVARAAGMKPARIKGLANYQWEAISRALAFDRDKRLQNAGEFLDKFTGAGRRVKQLSGLLLFSVIGFALFLTFYTPPSGPEIPFEELPAALQQEVTSTLGDGRQALKFGDLDGALFYFDKAYALHPRNLEATAELEKLVEQVLKAKPAATDTAAMATFKYQIEQLLKYESLAQNPELLNSLKSQP